MIFYQINTTKVTTDQLKNAIFCGTKDPRIHYFYFLTFPKTKSIEDVFAVVEAKRMTLKNPDLHDFMCLELLHDSSTALNTLIASVETAANSINHYFGNDLYIATLVYDEEEDRRHTCIVISDIEKSLYTSSDTHVNSETLNEILYDALPEYNLGPIYHNALYLFNHEGNEALAYDGVIHLHCPILDYVTTKP